MVLRGGEKRDGKEPLECGQGLYIQLPQTSRARIAVFANRVHAAELTDAMFNDEELSRGRRKTLKREPKRRCMWTPTWVYVGKNSVQSPDSEELNY
jgi:hypothetical protein